MLRLEQGAISKAEFEYVPGHLHRICQQRKPDFNALVVMLERGRQIRECSSNDLRLDVVNQLFNRRVVDLQDSMSWR
jgi:hypothetical protein